MSAAFTYRAAARDGRIERGQLVAESREAALDQLARRDLMVISVEPRASSRPARPAARPAELAIVLRMLGDLLAAGVPVRRALGTLQSVAPGRWRTVLPAIQQAVREGQPLAHALASAPLGVPPMVAGIIQAGERGGELAAALAHAGEVCEEQARARSAIQNALAYPVVLLVSGCAAVGLLVGVVLPKFAAILADLGQALPPATRIVLSAADGARLATAPALLIVALMVIAWRAATARPQGLRMWHALLLRVPLLGTIRHAAATARIGTSMAAMLHAGVPLGAALGYASAAAADEELSARMRAARRDIEHGMRLSDALRDARALTEIALQLVQAGESAGTVPSLLRHAARIEGERSIRLTRASVAFVEPLLILAFGALVALVAGALLQALYSVRPA